MVSQDSFSCIKASRVGESCDPKETRCISPFSGCLETCRCYDAFIPTPNGRCRLASTSFVGEPCGTMGCEYPAKCMAGTCICMPPFRSMTEEEFWVNPLVTMQCQREDFSLWKCNGSMIYIPEELRTTTSTTTEPTTATSTATTTAELTTETTQTTTQMTTTTTAIVITTTTLETTTEAATPTTLKTTSPTTTTTTRQTTTTERMKVNIFDRCTRHEDCPDNSRCRPNSCEGFVCLCKEGYLSSADSTQCMIASRIGDQCDIQTKCMSPFAGCQSTCKCYDLFVASADGRCKLWSSAFVDEPCGEKGCEFPAKCYEGTCRCVAPYRKMSKEEFWVNPLQTSQCHKMNFSLVMCNGRYIDVPVPLSDEWQHLLEDKRLADLHTTWSPETTTEMMPTTPSFTSIQTTRNWYETGNDAIGSILNTNPNSRKLYTSCTSHTQCPTSARCRPNACQGFVCLCDTNFTSSEDNSFCFHAVKIGDTCNKNTDKCLSPFANCAGRCQCYSPFIPTEDGRCRHSLAAFVGESCGGRIGCEYPASCENDVCACLTPQRKLTEEEAWIYPLETKQCQEASFSIMLCNGKLIDVPEELLPEWADYITNYRSKLGLTSTTMSPSTILTTVETTSTSTTETSTIASSTTGYVSDLLETCSRHGHCPANSRCRPRSCDGYVCICTRGYVASDDKKTCLKAVRAGEQCDPDVSKCISPFAACAGVCRCYDPFISSADGRCKVKTANFIGESCGGKGCDHPGSCVSGTCQCRTPYRRKTAEEFWADPFGTSLCSRESSSLRECNGEPIALPEGLTEDTFYNDNTTYWPDAEEWNEGKNNTGPSNPDSNVFLWKLFTIPPNTGFDGKVGSGDDGNTSGSQNLANSGNDEPSLWNTGKGSGMTQGDWRKSYEIGPEGSDGMFPYGTNKDWEMADILGKCFMHEQCPDHSYCGPMACDGYVCLCNPGYVPSDDRTTCLAAVLVGDVCNPANSNCLSPFADCDGTCQCYDVFETSQDGRCRTKTAGFISDICGGNVGCEFPATCVDGECACADPYRRLTRNEFWADMTRTRQCQKKEFALYLCDGKPIEVPYALRNETDAFGRRLDEHGHVTQATDVGKDGPDAGSTDTTESSGTLINGNIESSDGRISGTKSTTGMERKINDTRDGTGSSSSGATGSSDGRKTLGDGTGGSEGSFGGSDGVTGGSQRSLDGEDGSLGGSVSGRASSDNEQFGSGVRDGSSDTSARGSSGTSPSGSSGTSSSGTSGTSSSGSPGTSSSGSSGTSSSGTSGTSSSGSPGTSSSGSSGSGPGADSGAGPENNRKGRIPDTGGLFYYIPQGGFFVRKFPEINADKTHTITLSDLQKDNHDLSDIHVSTYNMSGNSSGPGHSIDPDAVKENGFDPNETNRGLQPSYISPSYTNSLAGHQTDRTETLDSDQMRGVISSASPDILMHGLHTTDMVSTSLTDMNTQRGDTSGDRFRHNNDQLGIDEDRDKTDMEKPGQNPDVNEANISETVLMSSSISAVFLLNMVCIVLLIANRRRRKRKREQKARQKANDRSTVSEYEVYQLACPYVTMSSGPYVSATSGPYVSTSTVPYISTVKMENSSSENVTSSSGNESGYSTLPETSTESVVDSQGFDSLRIPRPHVKKDVNNIFDDTDVTSSIATTSSVTSRKRSSTMTYTTAKDSDIKYWFCEIPRPIVSFSKLKLKQNVTWGTWPKSESNPYIDSVASSTGNHTYEEIMPSSTSDTSA